MPHEKYAKRHFLTILQFLQVTASVKKCMAVKIAQPSQAKAGFGRQSPCHIWPLQMKKRQSSGLYRSLEISGDTHVYRGKQLSLF